MPLENKYSWRGAVFGLLLFLGLYFPYLGPLPTLVFSHIGIAILYLLRFKISVEDSSFVLCTIFLLIYFLVLSVIKGDLDVRLTLLSLYLPILYFSAKFLALFASQLTTESVWRWILVAFLVQSITIIMLNVGFVDAELFYSVVRVDPKVMSYPIVRYPGFAYDAFSYLSVLQAFGCCVVIRLLLRKFSLYLLVSLVLVFLSVILSGRAGVLVVCAYIAYRGLALGVSYITYVVCGVLLGSVVWALDWQSYEWYKSWAFSFIGDFILTGSVTDSSVRALGNHLFLPSHIFMGDDVFFLDVPSDMGFTRIINSAGVLGVFFASLIFVVLAVKALIKRNFLLVFFVVSLAFLNFKDVYFVAPYGHFFLLFFLMHRDSTCSNKYTCRV